MNNSTDKLQTVCISETRIQKGSNPTEDINLANYRIESTPTEAEKGGTLIYVSRKYEHKLRKDLEIYETKKVESTFIEIINKNGKNIIIGCIYRHHTITKNEFNSLLSPLISKITKEKKTCYLAGDFNMDLLHLEKENDIKDYFDLLTTNNFMPLITIPTRIAKSSKTLIDNIFFNEFSSEIISGNLTVGISDHMPQFTLIPNNTLKPSNENTPTIKTVRKYNQIDINQFNEDLSKINWDAAESEDANLFGNNLLHVFDQILDVHAPKTAIKIKKHSKRNAKPWITKT